jgi:Tat protein secretion system quality control protein TatD with DNase activity
MIIDVHTHIFPDKVCNDRKRFFDEKGFSLLYSSEKSKTVNAGVLLETMQAERVDYAVALGFQWQRREMALLHNEAMQQAIEAAKGRILGFGCIAREETDIDYAAKNLAAAGFRGIGEVAFYEGMADAEFDFLEQVLAAGGKYGLAVNLHCSEGPGHQYSGKHEMSLMRYTMFWVITGRPKQFAHIMAGD